jgi:hypothetical protein
MSALATYLRELNDVHSSGAAVPETSYYPALSNLLSEVGDSLRPKVRCVINPKNQGGGIPDGGLFLDSQLKNNPQVKSLKGPPPARGVMEVKGAKPDVSSIVGSQQVANYLNTYGQVLVTNLREFVLVGFDTAGGHLELESHVLAASEADFWALAASHKIEASDAMRFEEFLARVMLRGAPLSEPRDVAWFLASSLRAHPPAGDGWRRGNSNAEKGVAMNVALVGGRSHPGDHTRGNYLLIHRRASQFGGRDGAPHADEDRQPRILPGG